MKKNRLLRICYKHQTVMVSPLTNKWTNVELKRDDLVCVEWARNHYLTVDLNNTHPNTYPFEPEDE